MPNNNDALKKWEDTVEEKAQEEHDRLEETQEDVLEIIQQNSK